MDLSQDTTQQVQAVGFDLIDFSPLSTSVLAWTIHLVNSHQQDSLMTITCFDVPLYNDGPISIGDRLEFKIKGTTKTIVMFVRAITTPSNAATTKTNIQLGTQLIVLDTIPTKKMRLTKKPTISDVFSMVIRDLKLDLAGVNYNGLEKEPFPAGQFTCDLTKTVLSQLTIGMAQKGKTIFNFWFDAENYLNIGPTSYSDAKTVLDGEQMKMYLLAYTPDIRHRYEDKQLVVSSQKTKPRANSQSAPIVETTSGANDYAPSSIIRTNPRTSSEEKYTVSEKVLKRLAVNAMSFTLDLAGGWFIPCGLGAQVKGFNYGNAKYLHTQTQIACDGTKTTTRFVLEQPEVTMYQRPKSVNKKASGQESKSPVVSTTSDGQGNLVTEVK